MLDTSDVHTHVTLAIGMFLCFTLRSKRIEVLVGNSLFRNVILNRTDCPRCQIAILNRTNCPPVLPRIQIS